jgi:hypothetical protein
VPPLDTSTSSTIASTITTTTGLSIIPITTGAATTCVSDTSTEAFNVQSEDDDDLVGIIVGAVVGGLCIVVAIVTIVLFIVRRRAKQQQNQSNGDVNMTQYIPYQPTNSSEVSPPPPQRSRGNLGLDKYTIEYKELKFVNELGHGVCIIHVNQ